VERGGAAGRDVDAMDTARLEAFSDGVFAIAITLLVLEFKVPSGPGPLAPQLLAQWPSHVAFLTSFGTVGIMLLNHHRLFTFIDRVDRPLLVMNGLLLLGVTFVPFPTAVAAAYLDRADSRVAATFYSGTFFLIAIAFNLLWRYASSPRRADRLLCVPADHPGVLAIRRQYRGGPLLYLAALLAALWNGKLGFGINLALAVFFALPPRVPAGGAID